MQGSREEAVETLLAIEKGQRLAEDVTGTRLACTAVLEVLFEAKDWAGLNEHIILLSKRRSQLKQVGAGQQGFSQGIALARVVICVVIPG